MRKSAFQATLPAFTAVMQVGSPSSQFAGRVHLNPISSPHNTDHLPFGHYISTAHTSPLGYMLYALNSFLGHLQPSPLPHAGRGIEWDLLTNLHRERRRRAYVSCGRQLHLVLRQTPTRRFSS